MNKSGIYKITNNFDGKFYIGSSIDLKRRRSEHFRHLKHGIHHSSYLQNAYNKHGISNFKFEIIEYANEEDIRDIEQKYLDTLKSYKRNVGYNLSERSDCPVVNGINAKLSEYEVEQIKKLTLQGVTQSELAIKYKVTISTVNKIIMCKNWAWVLPDLNDQIIKFNDKQRIRRNKQINNYYELGKTRKEIAILLECGISTISNVLEVSSNQEYREKKLLMEADFKAGMDRSAIMEKYGEARSVVNFAIKEVYQNSLNKTYEEWCDLRKYGMSVKDISTTYNVHRGIVTTNTNRLLGITDRRIKVVQLDETYKKLNGYDSIQDAAKENNIDHTNIVACCKGRRNIAGGYKWMYAAEYEALTF